MIKLFAVKGWLTVTGIRIALTSITDRDMLIKHCFTHPIPPAVVKIGLIDDNPGHMDKNEILDLLIRKHYGLISEAEEAALQQVLASNSEARAMQLEVQDHPNEKILALMKKMDLAEAALHIHVKYQAMLAHRDIR